MTEVSEDRATQGLVIGIGALVGFIIKLGQSGFLYIFLVSLYFRMSFVH